MLDLNGRENSKVIAFSGCQDDQTSADLSPADPKKGAYGAFTTCFGNLNICLFLKTPYFDPKSTFFWQPPKSWKNFQNP